MAFHMTLGRALGSMISGIGLYNIFFEIQETIRREYEHLEIFKRVLL